MTGAADPRPDPGSPSITTPASGAPARRGVVVGVDGSTAGRLAVRWAAGEAARRGLPLHVLHGGAPIGAGTIVDDALAQAAGLVPGLTLTAVSRQERPAEALVQASVDAECVVVGARGRGALATAALGSVSMEVALHAHSPVVVVKGLEDPERPRDGVVVGLDGSPDSQPCLAYAFEQAASRGTWLDAVYACAAERAGWVPGSSRVTASYRKEQLGRLALAEALAGWAEEYPDVELHQAVADEDPVTALLRHSDGAQLLVVGSRGRGGFAGLVAGSVSRGLLHRAGCPVAVVRGGVRH